MSFLFINDLVITGEGRLDCQTASGKLIKVICDQSARSGVPVIAVVGLYQSGYDAETDLGLQQVFVLEKNDQTLEESINNPEPAFVQVAHRICRWLKQ